MRRELIAGHADGGKPTSPNLSDLGTRLVIVAGFGGRTKTRNREESRKIELLAIVPENEMPTAIE